MSLSAEGVHINLTYQVISRRGKDENKYKMYKNEKRTCKACKTAVLHNLIRKFATFLSPLQSRFVKLRTLTTETATRIRHSKTQVSNICNMKKIV